MTMSVQMLCWRKYTNLHRKNYIHLYLKKAYPFFFSFDFTSCDPMIQNYLSYYQHGLTVAKNFTVVSDIAESDVKLIEEFNNALKQDEQKQYLLQSVKDYWSNFPSC